MSGKPLPELFSELRHPERDVRRAAAREISYQGKLADVPELIPAMLNALQDEDYEVRYLAAHTLGNRRDARAVDELLATLRDDNGLGVPERAASALGQIGDPKAIPGLLAALAHEIADVRWNAAFALGEIGDARAVTGLIASLNDRAYDDHHNRVCDAAARALLKIGVAKAVSAVEVWRQRQAEEA